MNFSGGDIFNKLLGTPSYSPFQLTTMHGGYHVKLEESSVSKNILKLSLFAFSSVRSSLCRDPDRILNFSPRYSLLYLVYTSTLSRFSVDLYSIFSILV